MDAPRITLQGLAISRNHLILVTRRVCPGTFIFVLVYTLEEHLKCTPPYIFLVIFMVSLGEEVSPSLIKVNLKFKGDQR